MFLNSIFRYITLLLILFFIVPAFTQENWHYSADELEQVTINGESARKFKNNVKIYRKSTQLLTDNAIQLVSQKME